MHYCGLLRVVRREGGLRVYAAHQHADAPDAAARDSRIDAIVDLVVNAYAPLPGASLSWFVNRLQYAVPQWRDRLKAAGKRARSRLSHLRVAGSDWYWPAGERLTGGDSGETVRLLAPFDPLVWDRRRFELLWGWAYRFEAYTPAAKRKYGYYALPLVWRDRAIGWANVSLKDGSLHAAFGYASGSPPRERGFARELEAELARMRAFLER
jgi:uncharacterized protein YcaQ